MTKEIRLARKKQVRIPLSKILIGRQENIQILCNIRSTDILNGYIFILKICLNRFVSFLITHLSLQASIMYYERQ